MADGTGQSADAAERIAAAQARLAKTRALKAQGIDFKYTPSTNTIRAFDSRGGELGYMSLNPANKHGDREIKMLHVNDAARGKGIASGLFTEAQRQGLRPIHSGNRSEMGDAFAKTTGTYVPPKETPTTLIRTKEGGKMYTERKAENKAYGQNLARQKAIEAQLAKLNATIKANSVTNSPAIQSKLTPTVQEPSVNIRTGGPGLPRVPGSIPGVVAPKPWSPGGFTGGVISYFPMLMEAARGFPTAELQRRQELQRLGQVQ